MHVGLSYHKVTQWGDTNSCNIYCLCGARSDSTQTGVQVQLTCAPPQMTIFIKKKKRH